MRQRHVFAAAALALVSTMTQAESWRHDGDRLAVPAAGVSFPDKGGTVALTQSGEINLRGEGVDNEARYASPDGTIEATIYVYLPAYGDAALTAFETGKAIESLFAPGVQLASSTIVPAGGEAHGAIRRIYVGARNGDLVTTAAFLKVGRWLVKLRVTGPAARRAEIEADLDAFINGVRLDGKAIVQPAAELQMHDCPARTTREAKRVMLGLDLPGLGDNPMAAALANAVLAQHPETKGKKKESDMPVSIADNGRRPVCVREVIPVGQVGITVIQPDGNTSRPEAIVGLLNDAGGTFELQRNGSGNTYLLQVHQIARSQNFGAYDGPLTADQLVAILQGKDATARATSTTTYKANGKIETTIYVPAGK